MRKAFTLIELLVVIAIIAVLVTILVPVVINALGESERTVCTSNLKIVGKAYQDYAHLHPDAIMPNHVLLAVNRPLTAVANVAPTAHAGADILNSTIGPCSMNTVWVLIARGMLGQEAFKCPGDEEWTARVVATMYGWANATEFSYGVHYPYAGSDNIDPPTIVNPADPAAKYPLAPDPATVEPDAEKGDWKYQPTWVLMADRNPGGAVGAALDHSNHEGPEGGFAMVTRVGNAIFYDNKTIAGVPDSQAGFADDIYTDSAATVTPGEFPKTRTDTVISPTSSRP